jgi:hypothetical protein
LVVLRSIRSRLGGAAAVIAALFVANSAHAIERQHHLGIGPMAGILSIHGKSTTSAGFGGGIQYAYGLTDQWNLTVEASSVVVAANQKQDLPTSPHNRPATVDNGAVGVGYVIDILRWVPYIGASGGLYRLAGGTMNGSLFLPGVSAGAGLDYQLNRQFAVGVAAREHFMLGKLDTYPSYTTVLLHLEYMWGY